MAGNSRERGMTCAAYRSGCRGLLSGDGRRGCRCGLRLRRARVSLLGEGRCGGPTCSSAGSSGFCGYTRVMRMGSLGLVEGTWRNCKQAACGPLLRAARLHERAVGPTLAAEDTSSTRVTDCTGGGTQRDSRVRRAYSLCGGRLVPDVGQQGERLVTAHGSTRPHLERGFKAPQCRLSLRRA